MPIRLRIPGQPETAPATAIRATGSPAEPPSVTRLLDDVEVVHAYSLSPAARAQAATAPAELTVADDDIIEIEVDGLQLWTSARKYHETLRAIRPEAGRGDAVVVDALPVAGAATRGDSDRHASAVRILRVTGAWLEEQLRQPQVLKEFAQDFDLDLSGPAGSWILGKAVTWLIERQLTPREGLYHWAHATRAPQAGAPDPSEARLDGIDPSKPVLVFIHGTASSTLGSFGEFAGSGAGDQWNELTKFFEDRIYAFEHKTLSCSPIENAITLADRLPARSNVYVVSHSRGGMVGDLLCLRSIPAERIAAFTRHGEFDEADTYDRRRLAALSALLARKQFRVQRFARAACPARGTLLASENLDQFLSVLTYLVGLIPVVKLSPIYEVVKRITLETVRRRWEPGMLPGLEAMTPASPLVRLLNTSSDDVFASLGVIAGDIHGGSWVKRFGTFISDRVIYDNRDNDLVVNTDSMFRGAVRKGARYVFDQGADVSHFNYFRNRRTRARVVQWLTAKTVDALSDFRPLEEAMIQPVPMRRLGETRAAVHRPAVVLVPDLMGSDLHTESGRLWLDYAALSSGGAGLLADLGPAVQSKAVLGEHYGPLDTFLSATHETFPFFYDWRRSTLEHAAKLADVIESILTATPQPVRILAHGTGGLVVRQLARTRPELWTRLCARKDARILLLGTPHAGSYEAVELLLGIHPIAQQLALLDPALGLRGVIEMLQSFRGVLELLPRESSDFFSGAGWLRFAAVRKQASPPDAGLLETARDAAAALDRDAVDLGAVCNVAGTADRTVHGIELQDGRVVLKVTTEGDGRVTHRASHLDRLPTWYLHATHGEMSRDPRGFQGILDLLQSGESRQLSTSPPNASRGGERLWQTLPEGVLYPTGRDLFVGAFGYAPPRQHIGPDDAPSGFRVSVVHGDLAFARFPIVVGHYEGDTIIGPESVVDRLFDGALTTRYHLGLYPGPLGTSAVVMRDPTPLMKALQLPPGAIVVGLGRWGELTAGQIANIIRRAAIEYVLQLDRRSQRPEAGGQNASTDLGLSVLLIGATASNLSTEDSVAAILRGIAQANLELRTFVNAVHTRIGEIEIVELYVDTAIEAARAARWVAAALSDELKISIDAAPLLQRGRHGRVRWAAARNLDAWRRWEISAERAASAKWEMPKGLRKWLVEAASSEQADPAFLRALAGMALSEAEPPPNDRLRFVSLSDRARAEVIMDQHQPTLIERLIQSSITATSYNQDAARALFELMVPNDLKDGLGQLSNVVFVLDSRTSAYPWELMNDGGDRPLCTRVRMVRQLQSATFRPHIRVTTSRAAYVVGDPRVSPPYDQLQGAAAEAQVVAEKLATRFEPTLVPPGATALEVLGGLFARPYRIVHLAGHGDYRPATGDAHERSGMVLDNGAFLTAAEVRKLVQVPELVFLNCCFIGQVGPEPVEAPGVPYNRLAASISRELIEMGVRAVVAAGWAVRDDAALVFARSFYDEMLNGATFGRALAEARRSTWQRFPDANTWGAYQAYGDPDFRLDTSDSRARHLERVAHEELLEQIDRIWKSARTLDLEAAYRLGDENVANARMDRVKELETLLRDVPQAWLNRSDVRVAVGEAYGELGEYSAAIEHFEFALDTGELDSKTTIKAAEQLLNFIARKAAADRNVEELRKAIRRLGAMQDVGPTSERYSLLGGAFKRLATVLGDAAQARQAILDAAASYQKAVEHEIARGRFDHYPVVNRLTLLALLGQAPVDWEDLLRRSDLNARERFISERGTKDAVFHAFAAGDIALVRALLAGKFDDEGSTREVVIREIASLYEEALQRIEASPRQVQSVVRHLASVQTLIEKLERGAPSPEGMLRRDALSEIARRLSG